MSSINVVMLFSALGKSKGICYPGQIVGVQNDNKAIVQMNNDRYSIYNYVYYNKL